MRSSAPNQVGADGGPERRVKPENILYMWKHIHTHTRTNIAIARTETRANRNAASQEVRVQSDDTRERRSRIGQMIDCEECRCWRADHMVTSDIYFITP